MVEIWQANAAGRYAHPADTRDDIPLEEGFLGFGRPGTADEGWFEFVTVKPGRVPMPDGRMQAPHLVVGIFARGLLKRLVTRLYFPDEEEANASDPVLSELDEDERATLVARAEDGALRFDIRLQGESQTTFFLV
jgi:protocatechuate 3,4-dioxygenase alpha subunit